MGMRRLVRESRFRRLMKGWMSVDMLCYVMLRYQNFEVLCCLLEPGNMESSKSYHVQ